MSRGEQVTAYPYVECDEHPGEIEYLDSGCAKCREESEARSVARIHPAWSRVTWYWIGVGIGTCFGVIVGYALTVGGVL